MCRLRHASMLLVVTPLALCLTGCEISHHSLTPVEVLVLDAETAAPLSDVTVSVYYQHPKAIVVLNMPKDISADTGTDGRVAFGVADFHSGWTWTVSATGYPSVRWNEDRRHPAGWPVPVGVRDMFNDERARREITVYLYREPPPQITVIVPNGYRGPLKVALRPSENYVQGEVGQREFVFNASETGYVGIEASPLLRRTYASRVLVRYADGPRIWDWGEYLSPDRDDRIALYRIVGRGNRWLYMIGTKADAEALRAKVFEKVADPDPSRLFKREAFDAIFSQ